MQTPWASHWRHADPLASATGGTPATGGTQLMRQWQKPWKEVALALAARSSWKQLTRSLLWRPRFLRRRKARRAGEAAAARALFAHLLPAVVSSPPLALLPRAPRQAFLRVAEAWFNIARLNFERDFLAAHEVVRCQLNEFLIARNARGDRWPAQYQ